MDKAFSFKIVAGVVTDGAVAQKMEVSRQMAEIQLGLPEGWEVFMEQPNIEQTHTSRLANKYNSKTWELGELYYHQVGNC